MGLGANEAPPAIMSVYLGEEVSDAVGRFRGHDVPTRVLPSGDLGIACLPEFKIDNVDRNRTSPFAFTGNKFEFRAVGSSHNPSRSNTFLNTAVADSVAYMRSQLAAKVTDGMSKAEVQDIFKTIVQDVFTESEAALFDGDNYSAEWAEEAERRGLLNLRTTTNAIDAFDSEKNYELFSKYGVLSKEELGARINVMREEYCTKILTEASGLTSTVQTVVLPAAFDAQTKVAGSVIAAKSGGVSDLADQEAYLNKLSSTISRLNSASETLNAAVNSLPHGDLAEEARHCNTAVLDGMAAVRAEADALEGMCDGDLWSLPTYHQMLFHQS